MWETNNMKMNISIHRHISILLLSIAHINSASVIEQRLNLCLHNKEFKKFSCKIIKKAAMKLAYSDDFEHIYNIESHHKCAKENNIAINNGIDARNAHNQVPHYSHISKEMLHDILARIYKEHTLHDKYEKNQSAHPTRSLKSLQNNGISLKFIDEKIKELKALTVNIGELCSFTDRIKNEKLLEINEFNQSKSSLALHDCFDHF